MTAETGKSIGSVRWFGGQAAPTREAERGVAESRSGMAAGYPGAGYSGAGRWRAMKSRRNRGGRTTRPSEVTQGCLV